MPFLFILLISLTSPVSDPVATAIERYKKVTSYKVTLKSRSGDSLEIIRYFYKKPGYVRMEFVKPYNGTVLVYNPYDNKVRVRPFGFLKPLVLTFSPDSRFVRSSQGHRVDESDIGALLQMVKMLQAEGKTEILGSEKINDKKTMKTKITGNKGYVVNSSIHRYQLWLDHNTHLPLKVSAHDLGGELVEEVLMDDLEINIQFEEDFFML